MRFYTKMKKITVEMIVAKEPCPGYLGGGIK